MNFSHIAELISPSLTLAITAKSVELKKNGIDVISFGAGEPDFNTPENVQQAAIKAIQDGYTKYTSASGVIELKNAIIKKFKNDNNLVYSPSQIIISTGAKQCLSNVFQALLNPGDEVILPNPYWVSYPELIKLNGGVPLEIKTHEKNNFKYNIEDLKKSITPNTKAIIVNSPSNPTGTVYDKEDLIQIANFAKDNDLIIISDEIYEKLIYDNKEHISIGSLSDDAYKRTIVINGMSKSYAMTGWRIGYAAGDENIIKLMSSIQSHTTSNPNSIAQYASIEALTGDQQQINKMVKEFRLRRDYMVEKISEIKQLSCIKPKGAFYVMINITNCLNKSIEGKEIKNSLDFSSVLLEKENVAVIPGEAFGLDNYIRLSYATSMKNIETGLSRINRFISKYY